MVAIGCLYLRLRNGRPIGGPRFSGELPGLFPSRDRLAKIEPRFGVSGAKFREETLPQHRAVDQT